MTVSSVATGYDGISLLAGNSSYVPPAFESIATITPSSGATSITFSNIPQTFASLQLRTLNKISSADSNATGQLNITVNNDNGGNYAYHELWVDGVGTSPVAVADVGGSARPRFRTVTSWSAYNNMFGVGILDIVDYSSTTKRKTLRIISGVDLNKTTSPAGNVSLVSGLWNNTSAITSITVTTAGGLSASSVFSLYGIKG